MSTTDSSSALDAEATTPRLNPWLFVPVLYFMQAVPVTIVQEVATVFYKDLGIPNEPITRWTSLISLPWSLQLLLGPLVDLNGRKRQWILNGQALIAFGLIATALLLRMPNAFEITLLILGATAVTSALCNIATDGFYILSMAKDQQAKFVGVQTTCYRLGRLFCVGLLVLFVGLLTRVPDVPVTTQGGYLAFQRDGKTTYAQKANLRIQQGALASEYGKLVPEAVVPAGVYGLKITADGAVPTTVAGVQPAVPIQVSSPPADAQPTPEGNLVGGAPASSYPAALTAPEATNQGMNPALAWTMVLAAAGAIYGLGHLLNRVTLPRPTVDQPVANADPAETRRNILRTLVLLTLGVGGFFLTNAIVRLTLNFAGPALQSANGFDPKGWILPPDNAIHLGSFSLSFGAVGTELFQLALCAVLVGGAFVLAKRLIRGTPMADALTSYIRQPGFPAIFAFILFYRFGEAMVVKMSPLFLKDSLANGGLAVSNEQLGVVKGFIGVVGIILGGLAGGWVVSKYGLRRAFFPIALLMHLPNVLYAFAAWRGANLPLAPVSLGFLGTVPMTLAGIDFAEQFGYGFGFAGYMVYLMWVAQRGRYKTTHYAIGTGMGALCIAIAGAVSGVLQSNFGYAGFFICALFLALPGLVSLFFIPHDDAR